MKKRPSRRLLRHLTLAAIMRAHAFSWQAVAARVGRLERTCRRWPRKYEPEWNYLYHAAREMVFRLAVAEAKVVLAQAASERAQRQAQRSSAAGANDLTKV